MHKTVENNAAEGVSLRQVVGSCQKQVHAVLAAHGFVPRLIDGGHQRTHRTCGLAVLGGPHPSLCKTSLSAVFAVNTCYRNDERQLVVIGQILDMGVCEIGGYPHVIVPVTAIIDDAHTSIDGIGHLGGSGVAGSVQTSMTALEKLITGGISVALEKIVDVSDVLVIVFVVIARTLAGSDTAEKPTDSLNT